MGYKRLPALIRTRIAARRVVDESRKSLELESLFAASMVHRQRIGRIMSLDSEDGIVSDGVEALGYAPVELNDVASASVLRQLRGLGAVYVYQSVNQMEGMTEVAQARVILQGLAGHAASKTSSVLDMICKGEGPFLKLYDEVFNEDGKQLVLKPGLHKTGKRIVAGVNFNPEVLLRNSFKRPDNGYVGGKTCLDQAKKCVRFAKKMLSLFPKLVGKIIELGPDGMVASYHSGVRSAHSQGRARKKLA
ncbi:hypothetical protein THAOC_12740 [Thalassiosira oceanica]|uniref:Uncharacterized protein n=1 Tax=Thalassiosira oceanica TaxID=159749 RepID=K0T7B5_THAOC|nr:hypothetical protein THAOC_12740 [Thalassiosira oceanica]|eukprot:EJK66347.1 hypothetical protein THAOC_12740 [Thalassiosira oceanica]